MVCIWISDDLRTVPYTAGHKEKTHVLDIGFLRTFLAVQFVLLDEGMLIYVISCSQGRF